MTSLFYRDLVGKRVHLCYRKYRDRKEFDGIILDVAGVYLLLQKDDGERIWVPKLGKRDYMTGEGP